MRAWKLVADSRVGYAYNLSEAMAILDWRFPGWLRSVNQGTMVIASDYSGQHRNATHDAYSFLVSTLPEIQKWDSERAKFRAKWLRDGRRISFKRLHDRVRARALVPFLEAAFELRGNLITILIDKQVGSLYGSDVRELAESFDDCFPPQTPLGTIDKMFTLSTLLALVLVGFRGEDQRSYWISDEDETLDTWDKREGLARLTSYLSIGFGKWCEAADNWFCTAGAANAPSWSEDLTAVPDLIAGSFCALSGVLPRFFEQKEVSLQILKSETASDRRARFIMNWIGSAERRLRSVLLRLEVDEQGQVRSSFQVHAGNF